MQRAEDRGGAAGGGSGGQGRGGQRDAAGQERGRWWLVHGEGREAMSSNALPSGARLLPGDLLPREDGMAVQETTPEVLLPVDAHHTRHHPVHCLPLLLLAHDHVSFGCL